MTRGQFWGMVLFTILVLGGSGGGFAAWFYANSTNRLILAVRQSDAQTVKLELARGANVNIYTALDPANGEGVIELGTTPATVITVTPLMIAAKNGDLEIVEMLINANADVSTTDNSGQNVIYYACQLAGNALILQACIDKNADIYNFWNNPGDDPISACVRLNDAQMLRVILKDNKWKAQRRELRSYGMYDDNVFKLAIQNTNPNIIEILIEERFSPSDFDPFSERPVWWEIFDSLFSEEQSYELIKALVKKSPGKLYERANGERPLEYAVNQQNWAAAIAVVRLADEFSVPVKLSELHKDKIRNHAGTNIQAEKLLKLINAESSQSGNNG